MSPTFATDWLDRIQAALPFWQSLYAQQNTRWAIFLLIAAGVFFVVTGGLGAKVAGTTSASDNASTRAQYQRKVALPKTGNLGWFRKRVHRWVEPITVSGVTVETAQKHIAIGATTGARKTTLIASMIMQARRPCVVIAGDNSPYALEAMRARGWRVWSADGKNGGLYVFEGTPNEAAQIVTVLLNPRRTIGDTGLQRGMARGVFRDAIQAMDDAGVPRSWPALKQALLDADPPEGLTNRNFDQAKANWVSRIKELMEALGPALGHDISVLDCVRSECGLFFDLNAFSDLDLAQCFGEAAVRLTQHAADKTGDFWWIIDELALFDSELLGQIVRTCRIRRVKFVGASQIISDFGKTLRGLVKIWFVGEQTAADSESRRWCSDLTMGYAPPENFSEHATPPGFYYVVADGRTQSLQIKPWHHPKPVAPVKLWSQRPVVAPAAATPISESPNSESISKYKVSPADSEVSEALIQGPMAMPPVYTEVQLAGRLMAQLANIWQHHEFPGGLDGCHESTYHVNNRGRPSCSFGGADWFTYALIRTLEDARLQGLDEQETMAYMSKVRMLMASGELTVDHIEGCCNRICDRPDHLAWEGRGRNSELHSERKREAVAA